MRFFKNKKGFTLVELVVVIAILGILAGIAIPRFMDATATARGAKIVADMRTIESAESMNYAQKGTYATDIADLVTNGYLASVPKPPVGVYIVPDSNQDGTTTAASAYTVAQETEAAAASGTTAAVEAAGAYVAKMDGKTLKTLLTKKVEAQ